MADSITPIDDVTDINSLVANLLPSLTSPAVSRETGGNSKTLDAGMIPQIDHPQHRQHDPVSDAKLAEIELVHLVVRYIQYPSDTLKRQIDATQGALAASYDAIGIDHAADAAKRFASHVTTHAGQFLNPQKLQDWMALVPGGRYDATKKKDEQEAPSLLGV